MNRVTNTDSPLQDETFLFITNKQGLSARSVQFEGIPKPQEKCRLSVVVFRQIYQ